MSISIGERADELVVPLDPDSHDERAVQTAVTLARAGGAAVGFVAVAEPDAEVSTDWRIALHDRAAAATRPARALLVRSASVADGIIATTSGDGGSILCMSTDAPGRLRDALELTSASAIVHHVDAPAILIGPHAAPFVRPPGSVVAFVDPSALADTVVEHAVAWAARLGVPLRIEQVLEPGDRSTEDVHETAFVARLAARHRRAGVEVEWEVLHAEHPAAAIVDRLGDQMADSLAVLGTHGRSGWRELRLGSVSMKVVHRAPLPVLLVR
ncbi:MAG: universal stress protein [Ilumatobacteraceae bacterium]